MNKTEFLALGAEINAQAGVSEGIGQYLGSAAPRITHACELFGLWGKPLGDVLEVGPFYGHLPFALRPHSTSYTVLEGDDPTIAPLIPVFEAHNIRVRFLDFFDLFGPVASAPHALPLADGQYDTIICWETMEHFNFNPVKFVRELYRILKPGGRACITVPNSTSFAALSGLVFGADNIRLVENFYAFEDYESNGKKAFYGFHWHEYGAAELPALFEKAGFTIKKSGTFTTFRGRKVTVFRKLLRGGFRMATTLFPKRGMYCYVEAVKPR